MPALGFGTLIPDAAVTKGATIDALEAGFRHFDQESRVSSRRGDEHESQPTTGAVHGRGTDT